MTHRLLAAGHLVVRHDGIEHARFLRLAVNVTGSASIIDWTLVFGSPTMNVPMPAETAPPPG
jgi:hypothetical protein